MNMKKPIAHSNQLVCDENSCTTAPTFAKDIAPPIGSRSKLRVEVISDVICPWCYIGKRKLDKAIAKVAEHVPVEVVWRPFELNPTMPPEGLNRREYRSAKFGSWQKSQQMDEGVTAAGAAEGIAFHFDQIDRTPNTRDAHRLIWLAQERGVQDAAVEAVFRAYFVEGRNMNDRPTLVALAVEVGIPQPEAERFFSTDEGNAEVIAEEKRSHTLGVQGVPTFVAAGAPLFSGAQPPELMAEEFLRIAGLGAEARAESKVTARKDQ
jgi:predicted DsbA family dithiol-disulfide isomerase